MKSYRVTFEVEIDEGMEEETLFDLPKNAADLADIITENLHAPESGIKIFGVRVEAR